MESSRPAREIIRWTIGPAYMITSIAIFLLWRQNFDSRYIVYYGASTCVIVLTQVLEWVFPYDKSWRQPDDQFRNEIFCTYSSRISGAQTSAACSHTGCSVSLIVWWQPSGGPWWPSALPFALQLVIAFVFWEFGLYWNHRLMHTKAWRFHVLHHKLRRLSWVNSGYGHPVSFMMNQFRRSGHSAAAGSTRGSAASLSPSFRAPSTS